MSRKLRIEYPRAMYHFMNRGGQREDIFRDDEDRQRFLFTLGEACGKTEWQVHAYCLMRNHGRTMARSELRSYKAVWSRAPAWHRSLSARPTAEPRHFSRIAWPFYPCRLPTPSGSGQNRQKSA